ncbi:MAG: response regulator [Planctomycetes bacterium]|nr:response regulator [Planctomycetota bacterium]
MSQEGLIPLDREVDAQHRLVEEIAARKVRQEAILAALPEVVILLDEAFCIQYANTAGEKLWGTVPANPSDCSICGLAVIHFIHPEDRNRWTALLESVLIGDSTEKDKLLRVRGSGDELVWMNTKICKLADGGLLCTLEDYTTRRRHETELTKSQRLESIGRLAGGLAHDFNNFLSIIMGNLDIAQIKLGSTELVKSELEIAIKACMKASDITKQMLTFSKGGAPRTEIASVVDLIEEASEMNIHGSKLKVHFDIDHSIPAVEVDVGQIHQVFGNLIINAEQSMPGGGELSIRVSHGSLAEESEVNDDLNAAVIEFEDQGCGIPDDKIDLVTDPYYTTKTDGTGLGLSTAFWIIQRHHGRLSIKSTIGQGTTVRIALPCSNKSIHGVKTTESPSLEKRHHRILIMDDNDEVRDVLRMMLETLGHQVEETSDGQQCVAAYQKAFVTDHAFDLVVVDLTVPGGFGGRWAFEKLREINSKVSVIVASGYGNDSTLASPEAYGFKARLQKPFMISELESVIEQVLR